MSAPPGGGAGRDPGPRLRGIPAALAAAGLAALVAAIATGRAGPVVAALQGSWLFLAGVAAGSVAFAAAVRVAGGAWARELLPAAFAGARFFGAAGVLLAALALAPDALVPRGAPGRLAGFAVRQLLAGLLVFGAGARFVALARAGDGARARTAAGVFLPAFAAGVSLWAFGFVLEPAGQTTLAVVPAWCLLGAFLSGVAWIALVAALRDLGGPDLRHDLGKLLFGLVGLWSYLLWALFLPTWYGNVPGASAFLLARWTGAYRPAAVAVLAAGAAGPLLVLLTARGKRGRAPLAVAAASILAAGWGAMLLAVAPSLRLGPDPWGLAAALAVVAGMAGLFLASVRPGLGPAAPRASGRPGGGEDAERTVGPRAL